MTSFNRSEDRSSPIGAAAMSMSDSSLRPSVQVRLPDIWTQLMRINEGLAREYFTIYVPPAKTFQIGDAQDLYADAVERAVRPAHASILLSDINMRPLVVTRLIAESQVCVLTAKALAKGFVEATPQAAAELNNIRILESVNPKSAQQEQALVVRKANFFQRMLNTRDSYALFRQTLGKVVADGIWLILEALVPELQKQQAYAALVKACQIAIDVLCETFSHPYDFQISFPSPYRWTTYNNKGVPNWHELQFDSIAMTPRNVIRVNLDQGLLMSNVSVRGDDPQQVQALRGNVVALVISPNVVSYRVTANGVLPVQRVQKSEVVCSNFVPLQYSSPSVDRSGQ